jgi:hypothetical protein
LSLLDRFRRGSGPSRAVRQGRHGERRPDERTENILGRSPEPPPSTPLPQPQGAGAQGKTVSVHRPPLPSPTPAPMPIPGPSTASDAEKTIYETVDRLRAGKIVGVLVGVDGPFEGRLFGIFDGENTIGRGEQCRVSLSKADRRISREHAKVIHRDGIFVVQPLKEKAVTRVNDEPTTGSELTHGDSLTLGDSTFRFVSVY